MSDPLFSQKGRSFEKQYLKRALIWELHKTFYNTANLACSVILLFVNSGVLHTILNIRHFILPLL